ncbi:MAG: T9SS type A sorting domain-containing protein [Bacteroidetes bacterium]|nr:T9SS type A sorting domain-containing protein [Bacteroidota bacterium]
MKIINYIIVLCLFFVKLSFAQLTGAVNVYSDVTSISGTTLTVGSSASFSVGGKILLIQMKGATIDITNTSNYGTPSAINNAGNFAFLTILSKPTASTIVTTSATSVVFTTGGANRVQIVSVRTVTSNATVTGNVTPAAWNGTVGGVVVLEILGSLTINAGFRIDATGFGFKGGAVSGISDGSAWCNWSDFRSTNITTVCYQGIYAQKGEGIGEDSGNDYGRGPLVNGGGGAGEHNGGGGGGGNVSAGGNGGRQISDCGYRRNNTGASCNTPAPGTIQTNTCSAVTTSTSDVMVGGMGGRALTSGSSNNKIFMGGGGGGGQQNAAGGSGGGNGGGIVIVVTNTVINNSGFTDAIRANGSSAANTTGNEGAGGGGAGGSILIQTNNFNNAITISASGGNGGNATTNIVNCRGPGGGGGGGLIWINGLTATPTNLTTNVLSGTAGSVICSSSAVCGGVPPSTNTLICVSNLLYCAVTPTANGTVQTNVIIPLPVKLIEFKTTCFLNYTEIAWQTVDEKNMSSFGVQKSQDAISWIDLTSITAINLPGYNNYSIKDNSFNSWPLVYYRLKRIGFDNTVSYSSIIIGKCLANSYYDFTVAMNYGMDVHFNRQPNKVRIYNVLGQFIEEIKLDQSPSYHINTFNYAEGVYIVVADFGTQTVSKKILVNYH